MKVVETGTEPLSLQEMVRYNNWANDKILEVAGTLTPEQYRHAVGGSHPSVQAALTHIMWAEGMWLERWTGGTPRPMPEPEDLPAVHDLKVRWGGIMCAFVGFVDSLTAERLRQVIQYVNFKGEVWQYPLWRQICHVICHSGYHRGQVTNLFRQIGIRPVTTDFLNFCDERDRDRSGTE